MIFASYFKSISGPNLKIVFANLYTSKFNHELNCLLWSRGSREHFIDQEKDNSFRPFRAKYTKQLS
jgi:hypothetical protein